jgi:hypothetical protein
VRRLLPLIAFLFLGGIAGARETYVVRFSAGGMVAGCFIPSWQDNTLFFNPTAAPLTVHLLGISDGPLPTNATTDVVVPAGRVVTLRDDLVSRDWFPVTIPVFPAAATWVVHLDVPDGVLVSSRAELGRFSVGCGPPTVGDEKRAGTLALPTFRSLVPSGQPQYSVGADLGLLSAHVNAIAYNAGAATAMATMELRSGCTGTLLGSRAGTIPPNATLLFTGLKATTGLEECTWYTVVTIDQPGLSITSVVADEFDFASRVTAPITAP